MSESEGGDRSENERQLVALLKSAQEEREELLLKQVNVKFESNFNTISETFSKTVRHPSSKGAI